MDTIPCFVSPEVRIELRTVCNHMDVVVGTVTAGIEEVDDTRTGTLASESKLTAVRGKLQVALVTAQQARRVVDTIPNNKIDDRLCFELRTVSNRVGLVVDIVSAGIDEAAV